MVPAEIQQAIWKSYPSTGFDNGRPSLAWRVGMYRAVYVIAEKEYPREHRMLVPVKRVEDMKRIVKSVVFQAQRVSKGLGRFINKR